MKRFFLLLLGAGLVLACRKEDIVLLQVPQPLEELRLRHSPGEQRFVFRLDQAQTVVTARGARLSLPPNAFRLPNGTQPTGLAELRVVEIYDVADMLLADMPTLTDAGDLLISGGEFRIQTWQGENRLRMQTGVGLQTNTLTLESPMPAQRDTSARMTLWTRFLPSTASIDSMRPGRWVGWTPMQAPPVQSVNGFYRSAIPLDSLGWWNLDYGPASASSVSITVATEAADQTKVYLRPVGMNGLARLSPTNSAGTRWVSRPIPVGMAMKAVVLQSRDGKLYLGIQDQVAPANQPAGQPIFPRMEELSEAEIVRRIRSL